MFKNLKKPTFDGFTMVELLIAVFLLSVGIVASLLFFTNAMNASEFAREMTVATTHGEYILEEMKTRPTLANITATNWTSWASAQSLNSLNAESVSVTYTNASADPLDTTVAVSWVRRGRTNNVTLKTEIHK